MSDASDLRRILDDWPFDPDNDARIVSGDQGESVLQVRTMMGIEQYALDGRPDGARPHGKESVLDYQLERLEQAKKAGRESDFELSPAECSDLFTEGTLYYFRYVRLFQLKDWVRTLRDTTRNLRLFDLTRRHAQREEDQQFLEKWRPYILRVSACAAAMLAVDQQQHDRALTILNECLQTITVLPDLDEESFRFERERSLTALRDLAAQIQRQRPLSTLEQLERQLRRAIEKQEFERAAQLRDRIRDLRKSHPC